MANGAYKRRVKPLWRNNPWLTSSTPEQLNDAVLTEFEQHPIALECPKCIDGAAWWNAHISMYQCTTCKSAKFAIGWAVPNYD